MTASKYFWVCNAALFALAFGVSRFYTRKVRWFGEGGSPEFETTGRAAIFHGAIEIVIGIVLFCGVLLDYLGVVSFDPAIRAVEALLKF